MPQTIAGIRTVLDRERRDDERRYGKGDTRVFQHERRGDDRREGRADMLLIDDEMILSCDDLAESLDRLADEMEGRRPKHDGDLTRILDSASPV